MLKKKLTQVIAVATIAAGSVAIIAGCGDAADGGPSPKDQPKQPVPEGADPQDGPGKGAPPTNPGGGGAAKPAPEGITPGGGKK